VEQTPDLLSLAAVAEAPVSVDVAARALNTTPESIMETAAGLVREGRLIESPAGYSLPGGVEFEVSPAVATYLAGHLADALTAQGGEARLIGGLLEKAGRYASAWRILSEAALDPASRLPDQERIDLLESALASLDRAKLDGGETEGQLRLQLARFFRTRGQTADAAQMLESAIARLSGEDLVQALGFAAAVADDLQHPQEAERYVALAELVASQYHAPARLGSLLTFHGRELSRLGFAGEAEATVTKGVALLEAHGSENQRFYGRLNQAWIDLDQGNMRRAEIAFARLKDESGPLEGEASQATQEAYWGRALYGVGRPREALEAIAGAQAKAERLQATAPAFIAHLAEAEGGILFERWEQALDGATDALEIAVTSMPSWENVCRYLRARSLLGAERRDEARAEAEAAMAATPSGSNGLRWRLRIEELMLELSDTWDQSRAEDLTDQLLQSRWLGAAVDLMTARAGREGDPELAAEAAALALQIGNPAQAAKALGAGRLWQDPIAAPVVVAMKSLVSRLPEEWEPGFLAGAEVEAALSAEVEVGEEETALLRERIDSALAAAGLSGEMVLSPAQRRSAGLVRRRRPARRLGFLQWAGIAAGMTVIAAVAAVVVVSLSPTPTVPTTASTTTTSTTVPVEQREIAAPDTGLSGTYEYRGDNGRSGVSTGGFGSLLGHFWRRVPGGFITTPAVAVGRYLYVAAAETGENRIYGLEQTGGRINLTITTGEPVTAGPVVAQPSATESDPLLIYATEDGVVHAFSALRQAAEVWAFPTEDQVSAAPLVVDTAAYVATEGGVLHAISLDNGQSLWRYPAEESAGSFVSSPSFAEGVIYLASREGNIHAVTLAGEPACSNPISLMGEVITSPVINGEVMFVGLSTNQALQTFAVGGCGAPSANHATFYPSSLPVELGPALTADALYFLENRLLISYSLTPGTGLDGPPFSWPPYQADDPITTPPVFADGLVYVGSQGGLVHAVDAASGEGAWTFDAGSAIRGEIVVVPGAVFATTSSGEVIAIAGE
jgi:outer membrane protein assembly factor BamB